MKDSVPRDNFLYVSLSDINIIDSRVNTISNVMDHEYTAGDYLKEGRIRALPPQQIRARLVLAVTLIHLELLLLRAHIIADLRMLCHITSH